MAIQINQGLESEWFIPHSQRDSDSPVKFHIEPMTSPEFLLFSMGMSYKQNSDGSIAASFSDNSMEMALNKVKGWENVTDPGGEQLPFSIENLKRIPYDVLGELITRIAEISKLSQEERKN